MKGAKIPDVLPNELRSEMGETIEDANILTSARELQREQMRNEGHVKSSQGSATGDKNVASPKVDADHGKTKKKKKKKKKHKSRVPKGFSLVEESGSVFFNSKNGWYFDKLSEHYYKSATGPFYIYDAAQKKLLPI